SSLMGDDDRERRRRRPDLGVVHRQACDARAHLDQSLVWSRRGYRPLFELERSTDGVQDQCAHDGNYTIHRMVSFGTVGTDWQERIDWARLRQYRIERARERMKAHGLGAMLCMYDENIRYITATLTPGWCRLKPGLRYAMLAGDSAPILFEHGDIGFQIERHVPWIPKENIHYSYAWVKGAAGPASRQQVRKFTRSIKEEMRKAGVADMPLGTDFIDVNMLAEFQEQTINWQDGMTAMMEARAITWNGYKSCMYRTYCVGGKPSQAQKDVYAQALEWLNASIDAVKVGATTRDIASRWPSAKEVWGYEEEDQAAANLWGHGLGLAQYDLPVVSRIYSLDYPIERSEEHTSELQSPDHLVCR